MGMAARFPALCACALTAALTVGAAHADVLPDNRADLFYSRYSGGGMVIDGYSALVREKFSDTVAVEANYFVDRVSGASIDALSSASVIKDERQQKSLTVNWVHDKTTYTVGYTESRERDYISYTPHFSLSQDMFGDLTTVTVGYSRTRDIVGENEGTTYVPNVVWLGHAESRAYDLGLSQILTRNLIAGVTADFITDDGYLANPYRVARYFESPTVFGKENQRYPDTRTSTAVEGRLKYYLPYRAAASVTYRYYRDTWGIVGKTAEVDYTQPFSNTWIFEGRVRYYTQGHAIFYSDLYPYANSQNFLGRDQDLAAQTNTTLGAKATYAFLADGWKIFKRGTATLDLSRIMFKYKDFDDVPDYGSYPSSGIAPQYQFNATIYQVYLSMFW
jgi:hypothetical protein